MFRERVVQRLHLQMRVAQELVVVDIAKADVPPHAEIRAIDLQHEPRLHDRLVLGPHRFASASSTPRATGRYSFGWNTAMVPGDTAVMNAFGRRRRRRCVAFRRAMSCVQRLQRLHADLGRGRSAAKYFGVAPSAAILSR